MLVIKEEVDTVPLIDGSDYNFPSCVKFKGSYEKSDSVWYPIIPRHDECLQYKLSTSTIMQTVCWVFNQTHLLTLLKSVLRAWIRSQRNHISWNAFYSFSAFLSTITIPTLLIQKTRCRQKLRPFRVNLRLRKWSFRDTFPLLSSH